MTHEEYINKITKKQEDQANNLRKYENKMLEFMKSKGLKKVDALSVAYKYEYLLPKKSLPNFLGSVITFKATAEGEFFLVWHLILKTNNKLMHYLLNEKKNNTASIDIGLAYRLLNDGSSVLKVKSENSEYDNQSILNIDNLEYFYEILDEFDTKMQSRYSKLDNIINDLEEVRKITNENLKKWGKEQFVKKETVSLQKVALYKLFGEKDKAIEELEQYINKMLPIDKKGYRYQRLKAYLDYLKHNTPLPYIPSPADKADVFQLTGNDIYICLNKKTVKDQDVLEYFGGIERFAKPVKVECAQMNNEEGVSVCKAGKWSILRLGMDVFGDMNQSEAGAMLSDMSIKYNRAILFVNQDTTSTFGFEVYKKGELIRRWMAGDGEVLENIGKPITGEKKRFTDTLGDKTDEETVKSFTESILKLTIGDMEKSKAVYYDLK